MPERRAPWWPFPRHERTGIDILPDTSTSDRAIVRADADRAFARDAAAARDRAEQRYELVDPPVLAAEWASTRPEVGAALVALGFPASWISIRPGPQHRAGDGRADADRRAEAVHDHLVADLERWTRGEGRGRHVAG